jgi:hypothetical protein
MDHNDFVFSRGGDGQIYGGGFSVGNILDKFGGRSPLVTLNGDNNNDENQSGGGNQNGGGNKVEQFSDIFKNYVVPTGIFSFPYKSCNSTNNRDCNDDVINDDLYNKLLDLVKEKNIKGAGKKTRRTKIKINKSKKGTQRVLA